jgi:hypothetical protein
VDLWASAAESNPDKIAIVRYEDLLVSVERSLSSAVEALSGRSADMASLRVASNRFEFRRQTGRSPGVEERSDFLRKGISGDWRNYFTEDAELVFTQAAGAALRRLGYAGPRQVA